MILRAKWSADRLAFTAWMDDGSSAVCPVSAKGDASKVVPYCAQAGAVAAFLAAGGVVAASSAPEPISIRDYETAVQTMLDVRARERNYENIFTAVTYADEPSDVQFQAEGLAYRSWRSRVWRYCYDKLAVVESGQVAPPPPGSLVAEILANVPLELPTASALTVQAASISAI